MLRIAYGLGLGYLGLCGWLLAARPAAFDAGAPALPAALVRPAPTGAAGWFARVRPRCNPVEIEVALRASPPPAGDEGIGYAAGCYALAGKIDRARTAIDDLPPGERPAAAGILFEIVHPVADAGDDRSAGPMMRLVLAYTPDNFQALYHAGMAEYALGERPLARQHLRRFLELYRTDDGWTRNAREVLERPGMQGP
jgi:hypothetical protein